MKNQIALIVVYFGQIPHFIRLFLKGCQYNSNVDFWFFTNWDWSSLEVMPNIKNIPFTLDQFNRLATQKCGVKIDIKRAYKLCDLKPAWPHIFEDYVDNYQYVGYCDIDLIFGSIGSFFTDQIRNSADLFTITTGYLSGALTIFKNTEKMRRLYQRAKGWGYIFQDSRHFAFDESLRIKETVFDKEDKESYCLMSFSDLVLSSPDISVANNRYIGYEQRPCLVIYDHGHVYAEGDEYIFFHYVVAKQSVFWTLPDWKNVPDKFYVNKYGFYTSEKQPVQFLDLICKSYYRRQVISSMRKKWKTIKLLIKKCNVKVIIHAIIKQFK